LKILITGGAGFIGHHLAERLARDHKVSILDSFTRRSHIDPHEWPHPVYNVDILHNTFVPQAIMDSDAVIHLAAISRVEPSIKDPGGCFKTNVMGTEFIARLCGQYGKRLVFASSREVYGHSGPDPTPETWPLAPVNPYGTSKMMAESAVRLYGQLYNMKYSILRLSNVYGRRDSERVVPIFIEKAIKEDPIFVYGKDKVLDFVHVDDVMDAFDLALRRGTRQTMNIGSGTPTTLEDLAYKVKEVTRSKSRVVAKSERDWEVDSFVADVTRADIELDWKPRIGLTDGLTSIVP